MQKLDTEVRLFQILLVPDIFNYQAPPFQHFPDHQKYLLKLDRLRKIIVRTFADTVKSHIQVCCTREHYNGNSRVLIDNFRQEAEAVNIRQADIKQNKCHFGRAVKFP